MNLHMSMIDTIAANASTFTLPTSDERYVILPESEFAALQRVLQDALNLVDDNDDKKREVFPDEVLAAIRSGRRPIGVFREYRRMSLTELANRTEISEHHLLGIENGAKSASLRAICAIAKALEVRVDDLIIE